MTLEGLAAVKNAGARQQFEEERHEYVKGVRVVGRAARSGTRATTVGRRMTGADRLAVHIATTGKRVVTRNTPSRW